MELLLRVSRELAASLDLRTVLDRVLVLSTSNVGAERGSLLVLDSSGQPVEAALTVQNKLLHPTVDEMRAILDHGLAGWVAKQRQPVLIADTSQDERWVRRPDDDSERSGSKSAICMPLVARDELVGVLTLVHASPGFFSAEHLALQQGIADLAGIAIRNAHLYHSVEEAQRRYHDLFEDSIDPIFITNWDGKILECNRQAALTTGFSTPQLEDHSVLELHNAETRVLGNKFSRLKAGQTLSYESTLKRADGQAAPVQVYVRRVQLNQGDSLQWIFRDISERKQLDQMRDDLAAMIYHDLRSPLANIISSLDILDTMLPDENSESVKQVFQIATRATERLQRLISSLLDVNRLEAGQALINKRSIDLNALIQEAVDAIVPMTTSRNQQLAVVLEPVPPVTVDPDMIRRVLINLLENAIKFSALNGSLEVGNHLEQGFVRVWIQDSGPGIAPDFQEVIFEKFRQLKNEQQPKGFGIGLSFCRLAVQAHGGKIWVESQPGQGSRFIFTLPVS